MADIHWITLNPAGWLEFCRANYSDDSQEQYLKIYSEAPDEPFVEAVFSPQSSKSEVNMHLSFSTNKSGGVHSAFLTIDLPVERYEQMHQMLIRNGNNLNAVRIDIGYEQDEDASEPEGVFNQIVEVQCFSRCGPYFTRK